MCTYLLQIHSESLLFSFDVVQLGYSLIAWSFQHLDTINEDSVERDEKSWLQRLAYGTHVLRVPVSQQGKRV